MKPSLRFFLVALALLVAAPAFAHSKVKATLPASGSILPHSPDKVVVTFNEPATMTSAVVTAPGTVERKLAISPVGATREVTLAAPNLSPGRNEIQWKALSKDGHVVSGSIILVIKPGATPSSPSDTHSSHSDNAH